MSNAITSTKNNWYKKILFFWEWNKWEKILLFANLFITVGLLIYQCVIPGGAADKKTWIAFVANVFNIVSVILATKKRVSCFIWGILAVIGFGAVAFFNQATGNWILYWIFYIPAQLFALYLWRKNSINKIEVKPTSIKKWQVIVACVGSAIFISLFSWIETINGFQKMWYGPDATNHGLITYIFDAAVLILSITMTVFTWCRFKQRWYVSIIVDACQIALWITFLCTDVQNISAWIMIVSSLTMLTSAIYGVFNWQK
ncbi:MAG: nicotinamide riboside transporter PnuC [Mycoplasmataceae bacterium]|nr:nicotinamide riboside transporter PnuC [Mycoplasmataceae bacterium]